MDSGTTPDDLALLQYTSGTVDPPRGVMLTHRNLVANVAQVRHWIPEARRGRETLLCVLPLAHSYGVTSGLNLCVALGGSLVLLPTTRIQQVVEAIKQYHPSIFPGVPALYLAIANYPKIRSYGVSSIKYCVSGSAPLPVEVQEAFEKLTRGRLVEGYGLTEASPVTHSNPLEGERHVGSIGVPLPGTNARIVDPQTRRPAADRRGRRVGDRGTAGDARLLGAAGGDGADASSAAGCAPATSRAWTTTATSPLWTARRT